MDFAKEYKKNIEVNQIKATCPKCKQSFTVFSEHIGRADCETCNILLVEAA